MKLSPLKFNSPSCGNSPSPTKQFNENQRKISVNSDTSQVFPYNYSYNLQITKNIEEIVEMDQRNNCAGAANLFMKFIESLDIGKLGEENGIEKNIEAIIKLCNQIFLYFCQEKKYDESYKVLSFASSLLKKNELDLKNKQLLKVITFNNLAFLEERRKNLKNSKKYLKNAVKDLQNIQNNNPYLSLLANNLSSLYLIEKNYLKAFKYSEFSLYRLEPIIFNQIKNQFALNNNTFQQNLIILLQGYINFANSLTYLQNHVDNIQDQTVKFQVLHKNSLIFYKNGLKLSTKYLGQDHLMTKKFKNYSKFSGNSGQKDENLIIESSIDDTERKISKKKKKIVQDSSYSLNQDDNFETQPNFMSKTKDYRINHKTHHRYYKSQVDFPYSRINEFDYQEYNPQKYQEIYLKMREMEQNLGKISELREKYEQEKRIIENDYQFIKGKSNKESYHYPQNIWPVHNGLFMENGGINPLKNEFSPFNNNNDTSRKKPSIVVLNNEIPQPIPLMSQNNISDFNVNQNIINENNEKQILLQKIINDLKNDQERINKENQEKEKEIMMLKKQLENKEIVKNQDIKNKKNEITEEIIKKSAFYEEENDLFLNKESSNFDENNQKNQIPDKISEEEIKKKIIINTKISASEQKLMTPSSFSNKIPIKISNKNTPVSSTTKKEQKKPIKKENDINLNSYTSLNSIQNLENERKTPKEIDRIQNQNISIISDKKEKNPIAPKISMLKSESNGSLRKLIKMMDQKGDINNLKKEINKNPRQSLKNKILSLYDVFCSIFVPKFSVIKKKVLLENEVFLYEFRTLSNEDNETIYRIEGYNLESAQAMKTAIMKKEILKKVLSSINYEDVLPFTHNLKGITKYLDFVKYFIMPFIGIGKNQEKEEFLKKNYEFKMEIWPRPSGIFPDALFKQFFDQKCMLFFHHILNNDFRIIIAPNLNGPTIRCEVSFDQDTMKKFFPHVDNNYGKSEEITDIIKIIENMDEDFPSKEKYEKCEEIFKKYDFEQEETGEKEYFVESLKKINQQEILDFFDVFIKNFEEFLKLDGYETFEKVVQNKDNQLFKIKIWSSFSKFRLFSLKEEKSEKNLKIFLKDGYETYGPKKSKIYAQGKINYKYDKIWKLFGVEWERLDIEEKKIIFNIMTEMFRLETFEKEIELDSYKFDYNPIYAIPFDYGSFYRTFVGVQYKFPLTVSYIGIQNQPIGVKLTLFDSKNLKETGVFFTINEKVWKKYLKDPVPKKKKRFILDNILEDDYYLNYILNKIGYLILMESISLEENNNNSLILGKKLLNSGNHFIEQIENVLTINNIINSYQKDKISTKDNQF